MKLKNRIWALVCSLITGIWWLLGSLRTALKNRPVSTNPSGYTSLLFSVYPFASIIKPCMVSPTLIQYYMNRFLVFPSWLSVTSLSNREKPGSHHPVYFYHSSVSVDVCRGFRTSAVHSFENPLGHPDYSTQLSTPFKI